jgi:hypothetical protein
MVLCCWLFPAPTLLWQASFKVLVVASTAAL